MFRFHGFRIEGRAVAAAAVFAAAFAAVPSLAQDAPKAVKEISGVCNERLKTAVTTGTNTIWANQIDYLPVEDGSISFRMRNPGCVIVRFSADASSVVEGAMYVRAVLDGKKLMAPGPLVFTSNDNQFYSASSMEWVLTDVKAGKHTVSIDWRAADPNKPVTLGPRVTSVWATR